MNVLLQDLLCCHSTKADHDGVRKIGRTERCKLQERVVSRQDALIDILSTSSSFEGNKSTLPGSSHKRSWTTHSRRSVPSVDALAVIWKDTKLFVRSWSRMRNDWLLLACTHFGHRLF